MNDATKVKFVLILIVLVIAGWFLYPTIDWYTRSEADRQKAQEYGDGIMGKILQLGLDLKGGIHIVLQVDDSKLDKKTSGPEALNRAMEVIRNRIDQLGVTEPVIQKQGLDLILIQLPGIEDADRAIDIIGKTALLEFKLVEDNLDKIKELLGDKKLSDVLTDDGAKKALADAGYEGLLDKEKKIYIVHREAEVTGATLTDAKVEFGGQFNQPHVTINFNKEGAKQFSKVTGDNVNRQLAIVLDDRIQSAPVIRTQIPDGNAIIEGNFTTQDASDLALILRSGALPVPLKIAEKRVVGPSLGKDSIQKGIIAMIAGGIAIVIFMILYYKLAGLIADVALVLNLLILLGAMAGLRATLTLPGIAGIILMLGMAVDANVLIFERIREEINNGKTIRVAVDSGYEKAFKTILDSNITTLLAAAFMFQFGTGPVKGFAVTLSIGITASMFTAVVVTHVIFDLMLSGGRAIDHLSI
ncbi:MAG: protein translocase subunit SecD [bacterium]